MKIFIIGGCGFIGFNVFLLLKKKNYNDITIIDNLSGQSSRKNYLKIKKNFKNIKFFNIDISQDEKIFTLIKKNKPNVILAMHGQVAVTKSIKDPRLDFNNNFLSVFNILESIRKFSPKSTLINLSSNKVYGKIEKIKLNEKKLRYVSSDLVDEKYPLNFESPYGCSKGAADQYVIDYAKLYNLKTVSLRLSCVYGENQWGTEDQGWIAWFIKCALHNNKIKLFGTGKQVRDVLHVSDLTNLIYLCVKKSNSIKGHAFNIGGGPKNTLSLLELINKIEIKLKTKINFSFKKERFGDQKFFVNNLSKIKKMTGWYPKVSVNDGLKKYINWIKFKDKK
jgi:CDP-paratose 2-epimerase|tara:strand:+ start:334 stop:1341 length:1008 start_codon:yes stop_codon:yes gene_type:complete